MRCEDALDMMCGEARKQGASDFDVVAGESTAMGLDLFEGQVKNTEISSSRGLGIRLFVEGKPGYAFTEKFSPEAIRQCVRDAVSHTKLTDVLEVELPGPSEAPAVELDLWHDAIESLGVDAMKGAGLTLENAAREADQRVENIPYLSVGKSSGQSWLRNSKGLDVGIRRNSLSAGLGVVAVEGESRKMGVYFNSAPGLDHFDLPWMSRTAVDRAVELLGASSLDSGQYPVILSNRISGRLISMYTPPFYAEVVQKGQSKLEGKVGETVAVPEWQVTCNPHVPGLPGSHLWDSEGIVCRPFSVVENGVLKSFLYNLESARREGRRSTGHGSRGYSGQVGTGFSNLMVSPGSKTLQDLFNTYPRCLYVTNLEGGAGCSAVSGEISIGVQGLWVENGKVSRPVEGVTISGNYFDLLKKIRGISDTVSEVVSSVKVPDILVESMYVAG